MSFEKPRDIKPRKEFGNLNIKVLDVSSDCSLFDFERGETYGVGDIKLSGDYVYICGEDGSRGIFIQYNKNLLGNSPLEARLISPQGITVPHLSSMAIVNGKVFFGEPLQTGESRLFSSDLEELTTTDVTVKLKIEEQIATKEGGYQSLEATGGKLFVNLYQVARTKPSIVYEHILQRRTLGGSRKINLIRDETRYWCTAVDCHGRLYGVKENKARSGAISFEVHRFANPLRSGNYDVIKLRLNNKFTENLETWTERISVDGEGRIHLAYRVRHPTDITKGNTIWAVFSPSGKLEAVFRYTENHYLRLACDGTDIYAAGYNIPIVKYRLT